ncbi:hypothetical protein DL771_011323 [Monosporascus sp. 5C6A]|nr:hypothetical protein DL771_011323 [Monosporascus sp. 5C6A]
MVSPIVLRIKPRGKPIKTLPVQVSLQPTEPTYALYRQVARTSGYSVHRLRISLREDGNQVVVNDSKSNLAGAGVTNGADLFVKDLGPQIDWRTVFVIEYIGPLIIHPLLYKWRLMDPTPSQTLTLYMIMGQFVKRELETLFVHRFSLATMPARNIFKNSGHYWALAGLMIAWFVYTPSPHPSSEGNSPDLLSYLGLALFALGASLNTYIHLIQRSLRPAGTTVRRIPSGPGFSLVTCPNYMFETSTWIGILLVSRSWAVVVFLIVALAQMKAWASKKERRYRREFPAGEGAASLLYHEPSIVQLSAEMENAVVQVGYLGLILLVYEGGASISIPAIKANLALSTFVALTGTAAPMGLFFLLGPMVGATGIQCFAAGAALCATSLGTTFTVLATSGLTSTRLGSVISTAAMMDDVVRLVMVQIVSSLGSGSTKVQETTVVRPVFVSFTFAIVVPL